MQKQRLFCAQAPEPNEIEWKNLYLPESYTFKLKVLGLFLHVLLECVLYLIIREVYFRFSARAATIVIVTFNTLALVPINRRLCEM
jgi:membrane protein YdbS with pleckstrin-like domain